VTDTEYQLCLNNFVPLLNLIYLHGHVPDDEFLSRGFPADVNNAGEEVHRLAGITQEHCRRAKILSHQYQVKLRADLVEEKLAEENRKQEEANVSINKTIADNKIFEKKIVDILVAAECRNESTLPKHDLPPCLSCATKSP